MNKLTEEFIKESGIARLDKDFMSLPGTSGGIQLRENEDCTPAELLRKIVNAGKDHKRIEIFNALTVPESFRKAD